MECGILFKRISNVKMKHVLILVKIVTSIRKHAKWPQRDYKGEIVSSKMWTNLSKRGMKQIKSQFKKAKKICPSF